MRKHALSLLASMFESVLREVGREYIEKVRLDAQEDGEVLEAEGASEDMETQLPAGYPNDLEKIIKYKVQYIERKTKSWRTRFNVVPMKKKSENFKVNFSLFTFPAPNVSNKCFGTQFVVLIILYIDKSFPPDLFLIVLTFNTLWFQHVDLYVLLFLKVLTKFHCTIVISFFRDNVVYNTTNHYDNLHFG